MLTDKHYYAFISHSTRDAKVALWLRDKLVSYNIPASVQREHRAPKRLRPIFIYQTDLAGSNLQDALQRELDDSQWLIVICSPEGAKSPYVNGEIEYFIETGRADRIIPFIVAGTPHAKNPEEECFPPALLKLAEEGTELRGINLDESVRQLGSKMGAVVNVVATMLGVRFDSMWNVYRQKQRRRLIIAAACALVLCLAGLFAWDYTRPTYRCFADYVDRWGVPEGIIELNKEQQSHRHRMYLFEYRRIPFGEPNAYSWRVVKVSYVNSMQKPQEQTSNFYGVKIYGLNRSPIVEIKYSETEGVPTQWIFRNHKGKIVLRHALSERNGSIACIADFVSAKESKGTGFAGNLDNSYEKSSIVRYVYERNTDGYIIRQTFHANNDYNIRRSITADGDGIFGVAYSLDSLGRNVKVEFLDNKGKRSSKKNGVAGLIIDYDHYGNISRLSAVDKENHSVITDGDWGYKFATFVRIADKAGNITEESFLDSHHELYVADNNTMQAKKTLRYDESGNLIEDAYYNPDGSPCESGYYGYRRVYRYDNNGNQVETAYYGIDGQLYLTAYNGAITKYKYDNYDNIIEFAYYDVDGNLYGSHDGVSFCRYKNDKDGNCTEIRYYDTRGNLCLNYGGYAIMRNKYDDNGDIIERAYFGTDELPCLDKWNSVAKKCFKYDDRGNQIEIANFDTEGNPCLCTPDYCAIIKMEYDDSGHCIETSYYGTDGQPCYSAWGYFKDINEYDEHGNCIVWAYYDTNEQPCMNEDSVARCEEKFDEQGNMIEKAYYGVDGQPCRHKDGYSKKTYQHDERGNRIEEVYYDANGNMCPEENGMAKITSKYDAYGRAVEIAFFGPDNKPCLSEWGAAGRWRKYDLRGNMIEDKYFGIDGELCLSYYGIACKRWQYDSFGRCLEEAYYDTEDKPVLINTDSIAKIKYRYDEKGNEIERAFYGIHDEPCLIAKEHYHKQTTKHDKYGHPTEYAFYDTNDSLRLLSWGTAMYQIEYDNLGNQIECRFYGTNKEKCIINNGISKWVKHYDERGNVVEAIYYDTLDNLVMRYDEEQDTYFARCVRHYDERGNQIEEIHYDTEGNVIE